LDGVDGILAFIAQSQLAQWLKSSRYIYPVVNAAHILGLATLFGSILGLDLRLLGAFRSVPAPPIARLLPRIAAFGLGAAIVTGALLFTVEPQDYAGNPAFLTKAVLVGAGTAHALYLRRTRAWRALAQGGEIGAGLRVSAALSLTIWTAAILAGRFIAF
jgi:hypothetical protein